MGVNFVLLVRLCRRKNVGAFGLESLQSFVCQAFGLSYGTNHKYMILVYGTSAKNTILRTTF